MQWLDGLLEPSCVGVGEVTESVSSIDGENWSNELCNINVVTRSGLSTDKVMNLTKEETNDIPEFVDPDAPPSIHKEEHGIRSSKELAGEQEVDPSLSHCWSLLKRGKGNFCLQTGILMRCEKNPRA